MFGSKQQKTITELTEKINKLEVENVMLRESQKDYDFFAQNSFQKIAGYDYSRLVTFEGEAIVSTNVRVDENGVNYCVDIEKNGAVVESYILFRSGDGGIVSHLANTRRKNTYEFAKSVANFILNQIILYRDRMGYKCQVKYEDRLSENYKELFCNSED